jgi:hypothetical protein
MVVRKSNNTLTSWYSVEKSNAHRQTELKKDIIIWFVRLLAMWPLLAYFASLGWYWRWLWRSRWNVDWQGKLKFSEKTCPSATFVHHKIPYDQTRVWTRAAAVGSLRLTAWAMARPRKTLNRRQFFWDFDISVAHQVPTDQIRNLKM